MENLHRLLVFLQVNVLILRTCLQKCVSCRCADVRENTIASLKSAASHGADFVEFDVQLSKDLVPVLYHDFYIFISMKKKSNGAGDSDLLQLPVKDLTLEQLQLLKVDLNILNGFY